jgi:hypothetical protein
MERLLAKMSNLEVFLFLQSLIAFINKDKKQLKTNEDIVIKVKEHSDWQNCTPISISQVASISGKMKTADAIEGYRAPKAIEVIIALTNAFEVVPLYQENGGFKATKAPGSIVNEYHFTYKSAKINTDNKLVKYAGLYCGYFVRSAETSVSQLVMLILPDGSALYRSDRNRMVGDFQTDLKMPLIGDFKNPGTLSGYRYIFNPNLFSDNSRKPIRTYLEGLYLGYGDTVPAAGLIRMYRVKPWLEGEDMKSAYEDLPRKIFNLSWLEGEIVDGELKEGTQELLKEEPSILDFFMGFSDGFNERVSFESVASFMKARLVPRFESHPPPGWEGFFIARRVGTGREHFFKRGVQVFKDGRILLLLEIGDFVKRYWGRIHLSADGLYVSISIDRVTNGNETGSINRSLYVLSTQEIKKKGHTFFTGLALILDTDDKSRCAPEIWQKVDKATFDSIDKSQGLKVKGVNLTDPLDFKIFRFLRQFPIMKLLDIDSKTFLEPEPSKLGNAYFHSACYTALRKPHKKLEILKAVRDAIEHDFDDWGLYLNETAATGALHEFEKDFATVFSYDALKDIILVDTDAFKALEKRY